MSLPPWFRSKVVLNNLILVYSETWSCILYSTLQENKIIIKIEKIKLWSTHNQLLKKNAFHLIHSIFFLEFHLILYIEKEKI